MILKIREEVMNYNWLIDLTIIFWTLYGISMIFAYSPDLLSESFSELIYHSGRVFLYFSLSLLMFVFVVYSLMLHPDRKNEFIWLLIPLVILEIILKIINIIKKRQKLIEHLKNKIFSINIINIANIAFVIFFIITIITMYLPDNLEQLLNYLFPVGFISMLVYFAVKFYLTLYNN